MQNNKISVILADDEPHAITSMEILLHAEDDMEITAIAADGIQAAAMILQYQPQLVFLDIQMPGMSGFDVLDAVKGAYLPFFIFVTAFDNYAIKAFEASALDYLLKPYNDERFYKSLQKARQAIQLKTTQQYAQQVEGLLLNMQAATPKPAYTNKLAIKNNGQVSFIETADIVYIESIGNYVKFHTAKETKIATYTFKQLSDILDPAIFKRIHKSFMVNFGQVVRIEPFLHGDYLIILKTGIKLKLSRNYKKSFDGVF